VFPADYSSNADKTVPISTISNIINVTNTTESKTNNANTKTTININAKTTNSDKATSLTRLKPVNSSSYVIVRLRKCHSKRIKNLNITISNTIITTVITIIIIILLRISPHTSNNLKFLQGRWQCLRSQASLSRFHIRHYLRIRTDMFVAS
jgi:hypothetical protein